MHETSIHQMLVHLEEYGVIICKTCQFAVQPGALPSHLLRHRIYRNERRQLLQRLSKLDLLEPDQVSLPSNTPEPLPYLTVHSGFLCQRQSCHHACVSSKRMSQHWSEQHNEHDSKNVKARSAHLQTFFRGNKIRYFEVNGPGDGTATENQANVHASLSPPSGGVNLQTPTSTVSSETPSAQVDPSIPSLNIQALRYFHHYVLATSLTLRRSVQESTTFYQVEIVNQALQYPFLMFAILGLSATHLAVTNTDQDHLNIALQYQNAAIADFRSVMLAPDASNSTALIAFGRFFGIQRCAQHQLEWQLNVTPSEDDNDMSRLLEFFFLLRGGYEVLQTLQHLLPLGSDFIIPPEAIEGLRELDHRSDISAEQLSHIPSDIAQRLRALPGKLMPLLLELDSYEKEMWTEAQAAANGLLSAFALSYTSTEVRGLWDAAEGWLRSVPDHFIHMLSMAQPGALVIFAYWSLLVQRLAPHYWFCQGQGDRLYQIVMANLPNEEWKSLLADVF